MRKAWRAGAALVLGAAMAGAVGAAEAGEPDELACIAASYSPAQEDEIDALLPKLDPLFQQRTAPLDQLGLIILDTAKACGGPHGWSAAENESAILHELGRLMELAQRRHGLLGAGDFDRVDALLASGDRSALWAVMERHLGIGLSGSSEAIGTADAVTMGQFLMEVDVAPDERKIDLVSAYLAAKTLQRISARAFGAQ